MLERHYITPKNTYTTGGNHKILYTPVVVARSGDIAHVYVREEHRACRMVNCPARATCARRSGSFARTSGSPSDP